MIILKTILKIVRCILKPAVWVVQAVLTLLAIMIGFMGTWIAVIGGILGSLGLFATVIGGCSRMMAGDEVVWMLIASLLFAAVPICLLCWGVSAIGAIKGLLARI